MNLGLRAILLILAVVCFVLVALRFDLDALHLLPLGLAFFAASFLASDRGMSLGR